MVKYKDLLRKYLNSVFVHTKEDTSLVNSEKENIYRIKKRRNSSNKRNMREASWRAACDEWIRDYVEDCKGASTPIYQLYNSYIEKNPCCYMDIGQFGKVLRSWFPYRKRRRGKQGAQIYVYQDVALKSTMIPRPQNITDIPQDPSDPLMSVRTESDPSKSCTSLNLNQYNSMMVGNHKVGPILVSIPDKAHTGPSTKKVLEDRPKCMVPLLKPDSKRKYEDENGKSPPTHKKKKVSGGVKHQSPCDSTDDSALLLEEEIKDEIEVEEESCLSLDMCLSRVPSPQPLLSVEKHEIATVQTSSEVVTEKHSKNTRLPIQTSDKHSMAVARQWVDTNLTERKGATISAIAVFEAYAHDHPAEHLPQSSLTVVIRGKYPTRRKRFEQDSKYDYYYQDLELIKRDDSPVMFPRSLETACRSPINIHGSTDWPALNKENEKNEILSSEMKNVMTQMECGPDIATESEKMEHFMDKGETLTQATVMHKNDGTNSFNFTAEKKENELLTLSMKDKKPTSTERKKEERQAIEIETAKVNPVIFTDKERGIPVAVANPPEESVFTYHGVPCVMIPLRHTPNVNCHVQDPTVLATSEGGTVVSPLTKIASSVSHEAKKQSQNIPSKSQIPKNICRVTRVTSKSNNLRKNINNSTHPSYPIFQGRIQIKTVASINATDLTVLVDKKKTDSSASTDVTENSALSSRSTHKVKPNFAYYKDNEKLPAPTGFFSNSLEISKKLVDEDNDINSQSLIDKAHVTSPSSDMDVLDYIKSEMAEDNEIWSVNVRKKPPQDITKNLNISGDALNITNDDVFPCVSRQTDHERNIVKEKTSAYATGVANCLSHTVKQSDKAENNVHRHDIILENVKNIIMTKNKTEGVTKEIYSQISQCNNSYNNVAEHRSVIAQVNVGDEVTENKNQNAREIADNQAEVHIESSQLNGGVICVKAGESISKAGGKVKSIRKDRRWDEDIRSFVVDSDSIRVAVPKRKKKRKKRNLNEACKECSVQQVNSSKKNPRLPPVHKEGITLPSVHKEGIILPSVHEEGITLSDRTFDSEHLKQTGERVKRAVLEAAFELLSSTSSMLTENEKARKLESALFDENPAVHYDLTKDGSHTNINDITEDFPCIPSSALEDLKLCSHDQCTALLLHHQACPQLVCQKCSTLRAAYVHITLLQHRCQVWHTFTKIIRRHSRACRNVRCKVLFCQYIKHELHLSGVSVLSNHNMEDHAHLEAEFTKCQDVGPHRAALHCSHLQDVNLPLPWMAQVKCQQQFPSVEAHALKAVTNQLMPFSTRSQDITTSILYTLQFAAAHCDHHT